VSRRRVRVAETFFEALDHQLADERGSGGIPSRHDFLLMNFPTLSSASRPTGTNYRRM